MKNGERAGAPATTKCSQSCAYLIPNFKISFRFLIDFIASLKDEKALAIFFIA